MKVLRHWLRSHWGDIVLFLFVTLIVLCNWKTGYFILGNDTYAPEINPQVSLSRYMANPAWRSYRALGVPSDSEQADIVRVGAYRVLESVVPRWAIAQIYLFFSLFTAAFGIAQLAKFSVSSPHGKHDDRQTAGLVSAVIYITGLIAAWMFASPLYAFLAAFTFLPLVLWALAVVFHAPSAKSYLLLYGAALIHTIAGMVPTTFIVNMLIILAFGLFLAEEQLYHGGWKKCIAPAIMSGIILVGTQLFWILPFSAYVRTNAPALTQSVINRSLTPNLIENEVKYSSFTRVPQFLFAWMDATNDDGTKQYPFAAAYTSSGVMRILGLLPVVLAVIGSIGAVHKGNRRVGFWILLGMVGWILLAGINPPFGDLFRWLQRSVPLFSQVFRWQSSKVFPMMSIPIAILCGYAILYLTGRMKNRVVAELLVIGVLVAAGAYQYHYFDGSLVNASSRVKIPDEYFALANYLQKNDPESRIYVAPEANTLYFRSYAWGFFGSSFLNYLIPNPVIEKAMTTGSPESEDAQYILEKAYNAKDPRMFAGALRRYKTPLVLYDRYAVRLHNGYFYDGSVPDSVLGNNSELSKVWEKGNLSLYRLTVPLKNDDPYIPVVPGHNYRRLNTLLALSGAHESYAVKRDAAGVLYPFGLDFDTVESSQGAITGIARYDGPSAVYGVSIPVSFTGAVAVSYDKNSHALSVRSVYPQFSIGDTQIITPGETRRYALSPRTDRVSFGGYTLLLSELQSEHVVRVSRDAPLFTEWEKPQDLRNADQTQSDRSHISSVSSESQVQMTAVLSSDQPEEVNICLFSRLKNRCIHRNHAVTVHGATAVSVYGTESVDPGDFVTVYIKPAITGHRVSVTDESVEFFPKLADQTIILDAPAVKLQTVSIEAGDQLKLVIPEIYSNQSYHFYPEQPLIPPVHHDECKTDSTDRVIRMVNRRSLLFRSGECADSVSVALPVLKPETGDAALVYWHGDNKQGIPLTVSLHAQKAGYPYYEDLLPYEKSGFGLGFVPLVGDAVSYDFSAYSYGIGRRKSINELDALSFQLIPGSWYAMQLIPQDARPVQSIGINQAIHPNWQLRNTARVVQTAPPVRLNGWEQGWEALGADSRGLHGYFWPDVLVYIGYGITVLLGVSLLIRLVWPPASKPRT